jgi:lipopolysaccharide export system protein LptA
LARLLACLAACLAAAAACAADSADTPALKGKLNLKAKKIVFERKPVRLTCSCGFKIDLGRDWVGGTTKCPRCGKEHEVAGATSDLLLEGDVVVTRTLGEEVTTLTCEKGRAKMVGRKVVLAEASGSVRITQKEFTAEAQEASFDLKRNVVVAKGDAKHPAVIRGGGMVSTGPEIVFYVETQRVEFPKGGESRFEEPKKPGAEDEE